MYNSFAVFKSAKWKEEWKKVADDAIEEELGIILTSGEILIGQLRVDEEGVYSVISDYMRRSDKRGVHYYYLDIADNSIANVDGENVDEVVSLLKEIVKVARPKYLFILGNDEVINVACWENQSYDGDDEVFSDLPYTFLDTTSPWEGQDFNCNEALRVGRLVTSDQGFSDFKAYFDNAIEGIGHIEKIYPFGLSALVWEDESNDEYSEISNGKVKTSPEITVENVNDIISGNIPNLFFFNLHGSDDTEYWYGQKKDCYPEALSPEIFEEYPKTFFLGVEACYGARYIDLEPEESIVKTALANKCLAFLGASKIAYGTSEPEGTCADIMVGTYIAQIAKGETAGDAHISGIKTLIAESDMDDSDIKTLAEFSLYGDPSACTGKNKNIGTIKRMMKKIGGAPKGIHIPMPNVRKASKLCLAEVDAKIEQAIDAFVAEKLLPAIKQKGIMVEQKTFKMVNRNINQKVYILESDHFNHIAKVYFEDNGHVHKALLSK